MIVVSGCPRSGTSLMMDIMRVALGDDRIIGSKFPQEKKELPPSTKTLLFEKDGIQEYLRERRKDYKSKRPESKDFKDMNPKGFWECQFTVKGAQWNMANDSLIKSDKICKIVSQGLSKTDPSYIEKIIYMIREPHAVAKSQERLKRPSLIDVGVIHSPEMFIEVTIQAAMWLYKNSSVPVCVVNYDDLLSNPKKECKRVQEFLGDGNFNEASKVIDTNLKRSSVEHKDNELFDIAEPMFDAMLNQKYDEVLELGECYVKVPKRMMCHRMGRVVSKNECHLCKTRPEVLANYRIAAEKKNGTAWKNAPCTFECLKGMKVSESVNNNFWENTDVETTELISRELKYQLEVLARMEKTKCKPCEIKRQQRYIEGLKK